MEPDDKKTIEKYEDRFTRRLGEIAILLHLAKSPEGAHAYEMRSKASEIMFQKRKQGIRFLTFFVERIEELKKLLLLRKAESSSYSEKRQALLNKLENIPVLRNNIRIQTMLDEKHELDDQDFLYLDDLKDIIQKTIAEIKTQSVIWSNISGIYPAIETLEKNSLIVLDREDLDGGRLKKVYKITDLGRESLINLMGSLLDISSFVIETDDRKFFSKERGIFSSRFIPFKNLIDKLTADLSPDFKKRMHSFRGKPRGDPFSHMMMSQGMGGPWLNKLIHHPEMVRKHLDDLDSEEDRRMTKTYLKARLLEQKERINKLLEEL